MSNNKNINGVWELSEYSIGISIYSRKISKTKLIEVKGQTRINASLESLLSILFDARSMPSWFKSCREASIIQRKDNNTLICYLIHKIPFTVGRDVVLEISSQTDLNGYKISFQSIPDSDIPCPFDCIRMNKLVCNWSLKYIDRNTTKIKVYFNINLGGGISPIIANRFIREIPLQTLYSLKSYTGSLETFPKYFNYISIPPSQRMAMA